MMRSPLSLIVPAGVFGVLFPLAFNAFAALSPEITIAGAVLGIGSWAVMPVVATIIAYRHGYDAGFSAGRKARVQSEVEEAT